MKEKSVKRNYVYNVIYQILIIIIPIITMPYVSRILGADGIGLYSYEYSIVTYFVLAATLGTTVFGQRAISYVLGNIEERSRAFWGLVIFRLCTTVVALAVYVVFFFLIFKDNGTLFFILALNIIGVALDISWFFQGLEEFGRIVLCHTLFRILNLVCVFLFVKTANDLNIYALIICGFNVLSNVLLWFMLKGRICKVREIKPFRSFKEIIQFFIPTIATQVYTVLDKSMIGWITGSNAENGYYEQAEKIAKIALTVVTALGTVMIPRIAKYFKEGNKELMQSYLYKSYRFTFLLAVPITFGLMAVSSVLIPVFLGNGYEPCIRLLQYFSLLVLLIGLSNANGMQLFVPTGRQNLLTITVTVGAVVNLAFNAVLIPFLGSFGACIATVIAETAVTVTGFVFIIKSKDLSVSRIFLSAWKYFVAGGIMFALVNFAIKPFVGVNVLGLAILILGGIVIYFLSLIILRDEAMKDFFKEIVEKLKHKPNLEQ